MWYLDLLRSSIGVRPVAPVPGKRTPRGPRRYGRDQLILFQVLKGSRVALAIASKCRGSCWFLSCEDRRRPSRLGLCEVHQPVRRPYTAAPRAERAVRSAMRSQFVEPRLSFATPDREEAMR